MRNVSRFCVFIACADGSLTDSHVLTERRNVLLSLLLLLPTCLVKDGRSVVLLLRGATWLSEPWLLEVDWEGRCIGCRGGMLRGPFGGLMFCGTI